MRYELSPCLYCSRTLDPKNCDNKKCKPWQNWFVKRWDQTRQQFCKAMETAQVQQAGVPLGGHRYMPPHRVQEYLETEPCEKCKLPKDLCDIPCPVYRAWEERKERVHELENRSH